MYCVKCGVKLSDTEKKCPLCHTVAYHPEIEKEMVPPLYPEDKYPPKKTYTMISLIVISAMFVISFLTCLLCDLQVFSTITWSGYAMGALVCGYVIFILPFWFKKRNPVIIVPCAFLTVGAYLAYINYAVNGEWFLGFVFPLVAGIAAVVTSVVALWRYLKKGKLYIFGGAFLALGAMMLPLEILINHTFGNERFVFWSVYPILALVILGAMLIILGAYRPAREALERKFFI